MSKTICLLVAILLLAGCASNGKTPAQTDERDFLQWLPLNRTVDQVFLHDVDGNGLLDLGYNVHGGENGSGVYFQAAPRQFPTHKSIPAVGFHPRDILPLRFDDTQYYLSNAEGENQIMSFVFENGAFVQTASVVARAPLSSVQVDWGDWGNALVIAPYDGIHITLFKGFNPETGELERTIRLPVEEIPGRMDLADVDGDGLQEVYFTTRRTEGVWRIPPPAPGQEPAPELLWRFEFGGAREVRLADPDQDGDLDLLVRQDRGGRVDVLLNEGGEFTLGEPLPVPIPGAGPWAFGVLDADGHTWVAAGGNKALYLFQVVGGTIVKSKRYQIRTWPKGLVFRDMNADGEPDLVMGFYGGYNSALGIAYGPLDQLFEDSAETLELIPETQQP